MRYLNKLFDLNYMYLVSILTILSVPDECYSRNESCALNLISTFLSSPSRQKVFCFQHDVKQQSIIQLYILLLTDEFEDTKGVIRIRKSKKDRQHNDKKKKVLTDKQRSTKHTYKTKDQLARTPLKTGGQLKCSWRVSSSCSTVDTRRVNLVTNPVISHEWGKDREVLTTSGIYPWS